MPPEHALAAQRRPSGTNHEGYNEVTFIPQKKVMSATQTRERWVGYDGNRGVGKEVEGGIVGMIRKGFTG